MQETEMLLVVTQLNCLFLSMFNKKFGLMLTRRVKAYSSSCLQTVSLSPVISLQFILGVCTAAEDRKNQ